jgi:L-iditol 2-dehydrogenase
MVRSKEISMLALVKTKKGVGNLELREVPTPEHGPDEVLIEVRAAGICGTDIHVKHDRFPYWPPVILCHEFSGVIVEVGSEVKNYKASPGWGIDGAFAKYIKMPEKLLHRLPDNVSFEEGAVTEPTANVVHDVLERGKVEPNDFVVVLGPGPIGLLASMAAKAAGAREVMIVGTPKDEELRLAKAREIGVDHVVNLGEVNPIEKCLELTNGIGADLIVEASGAEPAINSAVDLARTAFSSHGTRPCSRSATLSSTCPPATRAGIGLSA